jgi:lipid II:glycine glycyltransferase (peptidoglycan interpeptide bridge formation enzyme)
VVEDPSSVGLDAFLQIYHETAERKHLISKPDDYFRELLGTLREHGTGSLYFAEHAGIRLATALVIRFGSRATYFFGGSLAQGRQLMTPYLLHFEVMRREKSRGCDCYDLWGVAPEGATDHPWQAITEFKLKFGGERLDLVPTLDIVLDGPGYARYLQHPHP